MSFQFLRKFAQPTLKESYCHGQAFLPAVQFAKKTQPFWPHVETTLEELRHRLDSWRWLPGF
jgi:hypothetical protein